MNAILGPVRDLVDRRLWPVAVALVVAALAAPVLLTDREEVPPPAAATAPAEEGLSAANIVSVAGPDGVTRRRVLGAPKDPFTPTGKQPRPGGAATTGAPTATSAPTGTSLPGGAPVSSAGPTTDPFKAAPPATGAAAAPATPTPLAGPPTPSIPNPATTTPARPRSRKPEVFSLRVRFDGGRRTLRRLDALPDAENPALIYLGVLESGKTAVFLLDASVKAQGDGTCNPSPSDCQRLYLREGDTEFLEVTGEGGAQYQIDLLDIRAKRAGSSREATGKVSSAGRRALRARMSRVGRLRYDVSTGRLRYLSMRAWRAQTRRTR